MSDLPYRPLRLYRGITYVISITKPSELLGPILYDGEGFPVRWTPERPPRTPIGFDCSRIVRPSE